VIKTINQKGNMNKAKHSPLPWKAAGHEIVAADGYMVAEINTEWVNARGVLSEEDAGNMELILRAANSHNKLVVALKAIARGLTNGQLDRGETFESIARAAIEAET
jgi:hypothetical protein